MLHPLWIAFKICVYLHQKQHYKFIIIGRNSCELLSKFVYICIRNNAFETIHRLYRLWIAFKICVYLHQKQLYSEELIFDSCCELLSKFVYICIRNNQTQNLYKKVQLWIAFKICVYLHQKQPPNGSFTAKAVVNCFQNLCIFASETTMPYDMYQYFWLWIAFKICVYLHQKQLIRSYVNHWDSCELLSKFVYICIRNN